MAGTLGISVEFVAEYSEAIVLIERMALKLSASGIGAWMLGEVDPYLHMRSANSFVRESDPLGDAWKALAPSTIDDRIAQGFKSGPIQYRTGELYQFFKDAHSDILATQLGTEMKFPGDGQMNGDIPYKVGSAQAGNARTGAPPRPIMGITIADAEHIMMGLYEYVVGV